MDHTKNEKNNECGCKNNYTTDTFFESFGNDDEFNNCNSCPYLKFDCGLMTCTKFNK